MQISTILDHIDNGHMALPEFQRGYVWNRDQVRSLFHSLYLRHPIGSLLVWVTESKTAIHRGDSPLAPGVVKLLLDGQQRITSLYGVLRGKAPKFFDGNAQAFTGLRFHLDREVFEFYQSMKMQDDPLWVDVTALMNKKDTGGEELINRLANNPDIEMKGSYYTSILRLLGIPDINMHEEEVTGLDKTLEVVVDIFNLVNSGGTKLSKGDLALAKICTDWPEARDSMKSKLTEWKNENYEFNLDWLLRSVNTVLTGEAKFQFLHNKNAEKIQNGLKYASRHIDTCLNLISGRLGLDHNQVFFGRFGIPVMVRYLDQHTGQLNEKERDKLLFWYVQSGMWGRFSGSTESKIDQDLEALEEGSNTLDPLLEKLRLWHGGGLRVEPGHFTGWSLGARFYPVLYMITRIGSALDWGTGLPLKANLLGRMNKLEVHHIFPKAQLYKHGLKRSEVNALSNYCFLTKDTNLDISDRFPEEYFPEIEKKHPGALESQWIPLDPELWKIENYLLFLESRKILLSNAVNSFMEELLHGDTKWFEGRAKTLEIKPSVGGGISSKEEEEELIALNQWMEKQQLPQGNMSFDFSDPDTGEQIAIFDLAWPGGIQEGLSQAVAVLLNEGKELLNVASQAGYRFFTSISAFKSYVKTEILSNE